MSAELLSSSSARLEFGDIAALGGLVGLTVAFTLNTSSSYGGTMMAGQWGSASGFRAFLIQRSINEIGFVVTANGILGPVAFGETTSDSPMSTDKLHRIVCTWNVYPKRIGIWVNGIKSSTTNWFSGNPLTLHDTNSEVFLGYEANSGAANVNGDYSEFAIWDHEVPDWVAEAYGVGVSPSIYRNGGIVYTKAINTSHLIDEWESNTVTNTSGTTSEHPRMFYQPIRPAIALAAAPAPPPKVSYSEGVLSIMVLNGSGVQSEITSDGKGVNSTITSVN